MNFTTAMNLWSRFILCRFHDNRLNLQVQACLFGYFYVGLEYTIKKLQLKSRSNCSLLYEKLVHLVLRRGGLLEVISF